MLKDTYEAICKEDAVCDDMWSNRHDKPYGHYHVCDFNLLEGVYGGKAKRKRAIMKCKNFLKKYGKKRDPWMNCCDYCPHMRYVTVSDDNYILNICTIGTKNNSIGLFGLEIEE